MGLKGNRRQLPLIYPKFQLVFISVSVGLSLLTILGFFLVNLYFFKKFENLGLNLELPRDHVFFQFLDQQKSSMNIFFGWGVVAILSVLIPISLLFSHRIAGPLHRLNEHMNGIANGAEVTELRFRKRDLFSELADSFNRAVNRFKNH